MGLPAPALRSFDEPEARRLVVDGPRPPMDRQRPHPAAS